MKILNENKEVICQLDGLSYLDLESRFCVVDDVTYPLNEFSTWEIINKNINIDVSIVSDFLWSSHLFSDDENKMITSLFLL